MSLVTSVPISKVIVAITKWVEVDNILKSGTNLTPDDVMSLLEFVVSTRYFAFDGEYYQ